MSSSGGSRPGEAVVGPAGSSAIESWEALPVRAPTVLLENDTMRVLHTRMSPGERSGWHVHEHDHLVVAFDAGTSRARIADGEVVLTSIPRLHKINPAGVEHDVCNDSDGIMEFLEIEFKRPL